MVLFNGSIDVYGSSWVLAAKASLFFSSAARHLPRALAHSHRTPVSLHPLSERIRSEVQSPPSHSCSPGKLYYFFLFPDPGNSRLSKILFYRLISFIIILIPLSKSQMVVLNKMAAILYHSERSSSLTTSSNFSAARKLSNEINGMEKITSML